MDSNGFKKIAATLFLSGFVSAYPCSENLPPSYIDLQDAAYSAELDVHFHLCALKTTLKLKSGFGRLCRQLLKPQMKMPSLW